MCVWVCTFLIKPPSNIFQMRKVKHKETKPLPQGHAAFKW